MELHNLRNNSNNDNGQEKKIITNHEKRSVPVFCRIRRDNVPRNPPENAGSLTVQAASPETSGCVSLHIANEV